MDVTYLFDPLPSELLVKSWHSVLFFESLLHDTGSAPEFREIDSTLGTLTNYFFLFHQTQIWIVFEAGILL